MKANTIYLITLFLICSSILYSQTNNQIEERITDYKFKLDLTEEQCEQLRVILMNDNNEAQKERELNKDDPDALIAAAKARKEFMDKQFQNVLSQEQWEKYKKMHKQDLSDRQLLELRERLSLTDEQVEAIGPILAKTRETLMMLRKKNIDPRRQMQEMKSLMEKQAEEIEKYLTKEQEKTFDNFRRDKQEEMKRNRPRPGRY